MQYNRKNMSSLNNFTPFEEGCHMATISKVEAKKSTKQQNMFEFHIDGINGEQGRSYLVFGLEWSESNLQRILASVEDNNQQIAPIEYGYNQETASFLQNKRVFIKVTKRTGTYTDRDGNEKPQKGTEIKSFLTKEEHHKLGGFEQNSTFDSFDSNSPNNTPADDFPF